jgi:two-component system OmpR family sensor kinase
MWRRGLLSNRMAVPYSIVGLGVLIGGVTVGEVVATALGVRSLTPIFLTGLVTSVPAIAFLVAGGVWLGRSTISSERYRRLAGWSVAGVVFFGGFTVIIAASVTEGLLTLIATIRWGVAVGAGSGFLVGLFEARAIRHAVAAQQIRADELDRRRELLDYLNGILRHEILNASQVMTGYADLLEESGVDDATRREYARYIRREADELTSVTGDVQQLLETADAGYELESKHLSEICRDEVRKLRARYEGVDVATTIPEGVYVVADGLLGRLLRNLLENAVEHNDSETPHLSVTVEPSDKRVTIRVRDDGPGVPDTMRNDLFERTTRKDTVHGIGLSIVDLLADRYDGSVTLADTGPEGSVFSVELPRPDVESRRPKTDREPTAAIER